MRRLIVVAVAVSMAAACSGGSESTPESAPGDDSTSTTNLGGIPLSASAESLAWVGEVRVATGHGEGSSSVLTAEVEGSFRAPGEHRLRVSSESTTDGRSERAEWEATIVGAKAWVLEDGDLRAFDAEGTADEYMTVLGTATGCVIPSAALLADLSSGEPAAVEDREGRRVARFEIPEAPLSLYAPLFASDFGFAFGGALRTAAVSIAVDVATGLVVEARMSASDADAGVEVEMSFEVSRIDDPSIVIAVEDSGAPRADDLVAYEDPDGRFSAVYPRGWDVDEFTDGAAFGPPFSRSRAVASAVVSGPASTVDEVVDRILADAAPGTEVVGRDTVEAGGLVYERLLLRFPQGEDVMQGTVWATVAGGTGFVFQVVVEDRRAQEYAAASEAMFAGFRPSGG